MFNYRATNYYYQKYKKIYWWQQDREQYSYKVPVYVSFAVRGVFMFNACEHCEFKALPLQMPLNQVFFKWQCLDKEKWSVQNSKHTTIVKRSFFSLSSFWFIIQLFELRQNSELFHNHLLSIEKEFNQFSIVFHYQTPLHLCALIFWACHRAIVLFCNQPRKRQPKELRKRYKKIGETKSRTITRENERRAHRCNMCYNRILVLLCAGDYSWFRFDSINRAVYCI